MASQQPHFILLIFWFLSKSEANAENNIYLNFLHCNVSLMGKSLQGSQICSSCLYSVLYAIEQKLWKDPTAYMKIFCKKKPIFIYLNKCFSKWTESLTLCSRPCSFSFPSSLALCPIMKSILSFIPCLGPMIPELPFSPSLFCLTLSSFSTQWHTQNIPDDTVPLKKEGLMWQSSHIMYNTECKILRKKLARDRPNIYRWAPLCKSMF